jgi:hypothetical protein
MFLKPYILITEKHIQDNKFFLFLHSHNYGTYVRSVMG